MRTQFVLRCQVRSDTSERLDEVDDTDETPCEGWEDDTLEEDTYGAYRAYGLCSPKAILLLLEEDTLAASKKKDSAVSKYPYMYHEQS